MTMNDTLAANLLKLAFVLTLIPISIYLHAQAYYAYYGWFLLPLGAPVIGMAHVYGLAALVRLFTTKAADYDYRTKGAATRAFNFAVTGPLAALGLGWVLVHWIGI
jgi:hypothetical protein